MASIGLVGIVARVSRILGICRQISVIMRGRIITKMVVSIMNVIALVITAIVVGCIIEVAEIIIATQAIGISSTVSVGCSFNSVRIATIVATIIPNKITISSIGIIIINSVISVV
jgi:hypothetical protein